MVPPEAVAARRRPRRVAVLINPASGKDEPILAPLNRVLRQAGIDWRGVILQPEAEAAALEEALQDDPDAIWIYGGDGTVSRVATAMLDRGLVDRAIGVLGGGTANALAEALGAPAALEDAVARLCDGQVEPRPVDVGLVGDRAFLLRVTIGAMAGMTIGRTPVTMTVRPSALTLCYYTGADE